MAVDLGWVDIGLAVFLLLSVLIGLARGFVFELLSLIGWFVAGLAAIALAPFVEPHLAVGAVGSSFRHGVTIAIVFLLALVMWSVGARLVRAMVRSTPLNAIDRLLGAGFGLLRGAVVLLLVSVAVGVTPLGRSTAWQQSRGAALLASVWQELRPMLLDADPVAGARATTA